MSKFEFELNKAGVSELLKSPELLQILEEEGNRVLNATPVEKGYEMEIVNGVKRNAITIRATTLYAKRDNLKYNRLLKALG